MADSELDPIVIVGQAVRLPDGVDDIADFERLLFEGRASYGPVPQERFDRALYFDARRGQLGKSYTDLGGCVSSTPLDTAVEGRIQSFGTFDLTHRQFAQVAARAWSAECRAIPGLARRCGIYVGHSGGTDQGGPLTMSTLAEVAIDPVGDVEAFRCLELAVQHRVIDNMIAGVRSGRPSRTDDSVHFNAYSAASLVARLLSLGGPREVIDAACASSLLALSHAVAAIQSGRIDAAIVGGATYNNVDNLILFSQSQACSDQGSSPFDRRASGLISSEGYVAIVLTRQSLAEQHGLPILSMIRGIGVASDGRGKSLWAPRTEGQQLAIRRGYPAGAPLEIDYLEAHATSTQVGDATELRSLAEILRERRSAGAAEFSRSDAAGGAGAGPLLVGSVKSNLGHTLEAAGLVGLVKLMIAARRGDIPPTVHLQQPTPDFDWPSGLIRVVDRATRWPASSSPRRCAVNAFGIGGLNAHVVVESPTLIERQTTTPAGQESLRAAALVGVKFEPVEPIAIVGRGVVLPGAFNVSAFARLLQSDATAIGPPPAGRWAGRVGSGNQHSPVQVATNCGGYINGYQFDGQPYRIPPKQVQFANPVQMMLIDAVEQAAREVTGKATSGSWIGDRQRASVVIGTIFGGEFSNQLQIGLRLPELCQRLLAELPRHDVGDASAVQMVSEYRRIALRRYSALLDETGSFTASTLASRIAKSFDLMGGACAVDADDASGSLALMLAVDQLRSGMTDTVVCGVAQRSVDLVGFHDLQIRDRLARSGNIDEITVDCSRVLPGEGVAVVLLRRLSDACRDQMPVLGLIDGIEYGTRDDADAVRREHLAATPINQRIVRRVGYLAGAHAVIRLIAETIQWQSGTPSSATVTSVAEDGFYISSLIRDASVPLAPTRLAAQDEPAIPSPAACASDPPGGRVHLTVRPPRGRVKTSRMLNLTDSEPFRVIRLEAEDEVDFERALRHAAESPDEYWNRAAIELSPGARFCGGVIATSAKSLAAAASGLLSDWQAGHRATVLDKHLALLWDRAAGNDRVGWAFPGQGSQYAAVPQVIQEDPDSRDYLQQFDALLTTLELPIVSDNLEDRQHQLGHDIWWTQLWVLSVSAALADSLLRSSQRPDLVLGHSFGECGAALQAGVMDLAQAVRFAKQRSEAVVMTTRQRGQLLSIRGTPSRVEAVLASLGKQLTITHHNAPEQTVVAGSPEDIAAARAALGDASMASVVIPVPAAFHTPAMEDARRMLHSSFGDERFRPPRFGFFCTAQNRYLAEPSQIRDSLIDQLTSPLLYCGAIQRVVRDGCGLLIEVGPSDVLTRLHRGIVGSDALCLSLDVKGHSHWQRLALVRLATECVAGATQLDLRGPFTTARDRGAKQTDELENREASSRKASPLTADSDASVQVIDVTRRARGRSNTRPADPLTAIEPKLFAMTSEPVASRTRDLQPSSISSADPASSANGIGLEAGHGDKQYPRVDLNGLAERFLVDLIVELTGYGPEVIDFDADLEAELGVDSIKKAQIIGELAEWASLQLDLRQMKLSDFHTLADIRQLAGDIPIGVAGPSTVQRPTVQRPTVQRPTVQRPGERSVAETIESLMIDFIVDQTGYLPEVIDLDADLEAELGLDSIKKAQLLGELASHYELGHVDLRRTRLADFPTLRSIREFVLKHLSPATEAAPGGGDRDAGSTAHGTSDIGSTVQGASLETSGKKKMIRGALRALVDAPSVDSQRALLSLLDDHELSDIRRQGPAGPALMTVATSAGVLPSSLWRWLGRNSPEAAALDPPRPILRRGTCRFGLRMVEVPRHPRMPTEPLLSGSALILGQNAIAEAIVARLQRYGITSQRLDPSIPFDQLDTALTTFWASGETPHLFLTTPHDADALGTLSTQAWQRRRDTALMVPFRVCQLWMQRMIDHGWMDRAFLVSVLNTGGDFGLSASRVHACESGGLAGLTKAMMIEAWTQGFRETPMKVIDIAPETSVHQAVDGIFRELAVPSHDEEVRVEGAARWVVWPEHRPLEIPPPSAARDGSARAGSVTAGGTWIVSGGGRGITAFTSLALAEKYGLVLHLMGTAPAPDLIEATRRRAESDRPALRRETISEAQQAGKNPVEAWRDLEKSIEIDQTLADCRRRGIRASYHQVDVSDPRAVSELLNRIRSTDGPIRGVIHGAGAGQDARFDRKRLPKVEKCIRAKVDGCITLAEATSDDPLEWFVGFGSISGRFGANGHTDYSLANDMLAKVINRLRQQRGDVRCVTFHWHAWGDIGMATKPEARLALEMIGMEFMPAEEGLRHFLSEFEAGGDLPEVLITDRSYIRKFFPSFRHDVAGAMNLPLLDPDGMKRADVPPCTGQRWAVTIDPRDDRFLTEHRVGGRPTLPFVIALEMMAEAAKWEGGCDVVSLSDVEAVQSLKFIGDDAIAVEVVPDCETERPNRWCLRADLRRRDGRLVEAGRMHFRATIQTGARTDMPARLAPTIELEQWQFDPIEYSGPEAAIYHGEPFQMLRSIATTQTEAIGKIVTPSPVHLGEEKRPVRGWVIPCAVMDAMLYASAVLGWRVSGHPSLPVHFQEIHLGRSPEPGEALLVHTRLIHEDASGMTLAADLIGLNGDHLLAFRGYRISWLR